MTEMSPTGFPERVKELRRRLSLSQEDLAHAVGVSFTTINRWENGKTSPSKLALKQFNSLCFGTDKPSHTFSKGPQS